MDALTLILALIIGILTDFFLAPTFNWPGIGAIAAISFSAARIVYLIKKRLPLQNNESNENNESNNK